MSFWQKPHKMGIFVKVQDSLAVSDRGFVNLLIDSIQNVMGEIRRMEQEKSRGLKNLPIRQKLIFSHGMITILSVIVCVILVIGMRSIAASVQGIYSGPMTNVDMIGDVNYGLADLQRAINRLMVEGEENLSAGYGNFETTMNKDVDLVLTAIETLEQHLLTDANKNKLKELTAKIDEGEKVRPQLVQYLEDGEFDAAYDLNYNTYLPIVNEIKALAEELEAMIHETATGYYETATRNSNFYLTLSVILIICGVVLAMAITTYITKMIAEPVREITRASEIMFTGDMSASKVIEYHSNDELGVLADSMRGTMDNLNAYVEEITETLRQIAKGDLTRSGEEITDFLGDFASIKESFVYILKRFNSTLSDIQTTSEQVDSSSTEIAAASQALSEGATDQASAIEELTSTIDSVASMAEESAKKTQEAYDNIKKSTDRAQENRKEMEHLTEEMQHITEISREIGDIIEAIEDIASQTNLLSLNASIEAARAGEAGRGFAVVADQIGKLASDSAQSAVSTRELIMKTLEEIEKGNAIAASTSQAFDKVINDMQEFAGVAQSTNETAKSQAAALGQIEEGIDQISGVVQNTASASEESSVISGELSEQAALLNKLVNRFKLFGSENSTGFEEEHE